MPGAIDHVMINCNDYKRAVAFYSWLMPKIGYPQVVSYDKPAALTGWFNENSSFWIQPSDDASELFSKTRVGVREVAFQADHRELVDEVAHEIAAHGGKILDHPREYDYMPGYYAVFFTDPDGIKLEVVHRPR
jgi:glyoxylase I family protein